MIANTITSLRIVLLVPLSALILMGAGDDTQWWALALFVVAGVTDVLDGFVARKLGQTSAFGAMLDLIADRLLTAVTLVCLIAVGALTGWGVAAAAILIARDLIVASLNEALPGRLAIRVSVFERVKIAAHVAAVALLIAPEVWRPADSISQYDLGAALLAFAALLSLVTLADYGRRALRAFAPPR